MVTAEAETTPTTAAGDAGRGVEGGRAGEEEVGGRREVGVQQEEKGRWVCEERSRRGKLIFSYTL